MKTSVVIPLYNGAAHITACLDGLAAQTAPADEIIVVDDGSTDASAATVRAWQRAHPACPLRLVEQLNGGPSSARNRGARAASGDLLLFTDADCVPAPGWVAAFAAALNQPAGHGAPDAAMGCYAGPQASAAAAFAQLEFDERYALMARRTAAGLPLVFAATYSCAYRRDRFLALGGFDTDVLSNEDVDLAYRLVQHGGRIVFAPDAAISQPHDTTWWGYARTKHNRAFGRTAVYRRHPGRALRDGYTPQIMKLQMPLAVLATGGLAAALLWRGRALLLALPFLFSTVPMLRLALQLRSPALPWVPFGAWLRAWAFVLGVGQALVRPNARARYRVRRAADVSVTVPKMES